MALRLVTWNIRHGGSNVLGIARAIAGFDADVVVLPEFQASKGESLLQEVAKRGLPYHQVDCSRPQSNGVAVVARHPLSAGSLKGPSTVPHRWQHVQIEALGIELIGIYLHGGDEHNETPEEKQDFWDEILKAAQDLRATPAVIAGDLNTGKHNLDELGATFFSAKSFCDLSENVGWTDCFRCLHGDRRVYSWWHTKSGFRLDHAFVSPPLASRVKRAEYIWKQGDAILAHDGLKPWPEDKGRLSDHAALVVELE